MCAWIALGALPARADEVAIPDADGKILGRVTVESVNLDRVEAALAPGGRAAAVGVRHGRYGGATLVFVEPGRSARAFLETGADELLSDPIWSPDGALIAVVVRGPARRSPGEHALQQGGALWLCTRSGACARASLADDLWRPAAFLEDGSLLAARILPGDLVDLAPARLDPLSGLAAELPSTTQLMDLLEPPELYPPLPVPDSSRQPTTRQALSMPYIHQVYDTPNDFNGHWACGPTSTVMAVQHFNRLSAWPVTVSVPYSHNSDYGAYVAYSYSAYGTTFNRAQNDASGRLAKGAYGWCTDGGAAWAWRMQDYAERHDLNTTFDGQATFAEIKSAIDAGKVVALSTQLTSAGHIITVKGTTADGRLITNDPYGDKNQGYMNYHGEGAVYTWAQVSAKWYVTVHGSGAVTKGTAIGAVYIDHGTDDMDDRIPGATVEVVGGSSTTARDGDAIWSFDLDPGAYTIRASADGFITATRSCTVESGAQTWCSIGLTVACEPDCGGRQCGDNGCGGSCGQCPDHHTCSDAGQCECQPDCTDLACGPEPYCGASCGDCPDGQACQAGACVCAPACDGRRCGDDGCGGSCGECAEGQACDGRGRCLADQNADADPEPEHELVIHGGCATGGGGDAGAPLCLLGLLWLAVRRNRCPGSLGS